MSPSALIAGSLILLGLSVIPRPKPRHPSELRGWILLLWWLNRLYTGLWHHVEVENEPPFPETGPAILISNHTCGIDHLLLQSGSKRILSFLIAQEYYDHWIYSPFCKAIGCVPLKRDGRDQAALRASLRALKEGKILAVFPEGRINPQSGRDFLDAKTGTAFLALRAKVPVVPAYICGTPATNEIGAALYTPSHVHVVFGPSIDLSDLATPGSHDQERANLVIATERLMDGIRSLRDRSLSNESHT
jgi:1-acyl-sn-glycerol-3-phosphate acyltransferase